MSSTYSLATAADIDGQAFDYVIVGGGTAGCVLASRLSEDPHVTVAVLEAGKSSLEEPLISTPMGVRSLMFNPEYDWMFTPASQTNAPAGHVVPWCRGKTLGGSSAINIMAYTKPSREEMDVLEKLGNPGWNWESYQRYAKKAERFCTPAPVVMDQKFRNLYSPDSVGHDGKLALTFVPTGSGADAAFQQSIANNGLDIITDALGGDIVGICKSPSTVDPRTGYRADAARCYLLPALDRPNLKVLTEAYACRVATEVGDDGAVARSVEFEYDGKRCTVSALREVILSAGTIKTPQILELSGIGDPDILTEHGIETVVNLPGVGANVQERIMVPTLTYQMRNSEDVVTKHNIDDKERMEELKTRIKLTTDFNLLVNNFAFIPLHVVSAKAEKLIAKKKAALASATLSPGLRAQYEMQLALTESRRGVAIELLSLPIVGAPVPDPTQPHIALSTLLARPWSRGTIHIASADPKAAPRIDPGCLSDEFDLDVLVEGWRFAHKVGQTPPWTDVAVGQVVPPPKFDVSNEEEVREHIRNNIATSYHTCGSASMMPRELGGAVDAKLKVHGTTNLRVVDLSVLPLQISVHTQAFVYSLAEHAADIIMGLEPRD